MNMQSLHVKVSVSVAVAALIVVLVSSHFAYQRAYESSFKGSERSVQQLLETVSTTAAIAAYVGNAELAQQVVAGLFINDIVVGAQVTAADQVLSEEGVTTSQNGHAVSLRLRNPFNDLEYVGEVVVQTNVPLITERARESALATTVGLATQAAVVGLMVLILVYWMMSRPLARLSQRLHRITPGDGNRVNVAKHHRRDEIGLLTKDINALLSTVETMLDEERQLRQRVEALEHRFRGIFEDSSAGIFLIHEQGMLSAANPAFFRITGISESSSTAFSVTDIVEKIFADTEQARALINKALSTGQPCAADLRIVEGQEGGTRWVHCVFSPAGAEPGQPLVEGVIYDVTQRKIDEERTRELAEKDGLTGLFNRQMVDKVLEELAERALVTDRGLVLMLIDLDGFKRINDTYGHDAGDEVLKTVAVRLKQCVRETDIVARMGGDEFMIILDQTKDTSTACTIAQKVVSVNREVINILPDIPETISVSVGIAIYPHHGDDIMTLRRYADQAMYSVKNRGKNGFAIYDPSVHHDSILI
jgi:diguanylate cyclase (GGDEF)-like protein/PAS domain S-box-containing protein